MAGARSADILAGLVTAGPAASWPDRLVEDCRQATRVSGVGLALMGSAGAGGIVAATGGHAQQMEDLQFALGEGRHGHEAVPPRAPSAHGPTGP
jgi:hypothetical protein